MPVASARSRGRIKADRKKCAFLLVGKALDVRRMRLKQGGDHGVARFADIQPENFGRRFLQHAHSNEVLFSSGNYVPAGARELPKLPIGRSGLGEIADVR